MRRTGKTTRFIDFLVQELFTKGELKLPQHHSDIAEYVDTDSSRGNLAQSNLLGRFIDRLNLEHYGRFSYKVIKGYIIFKVE